MEKAAAGREPRPEGSSLDSHSSRSPTGLGGGVVMRTLPVAGETTPRRIPSEALPTP
jgi:hypothetical protein